MAELKITQNKGRDFYRMTTTDMEEAVATFLKAKEAGVGCRIIYNGPEYDHHYLGRYEDGTSQRVVYGDVRVEQYVDLNEMNQALGSDKVFKMAYAQYVIEQDQSCTRVVTGGTKTKVDKMARSIIEGIFVAVKHGKCDLATARMIAEQNGYDGAEFLKFAE